MIATAKSIQDIKNVPFFSQFTDEQIRAQVQKSLEGIEGMKARAIKTGKKVGGFTVAELDEMITNYKTILAS